MGTKDKIASLEARIKTDERLKFMWEIIHDFGGEADEQSFEEARDLMNQLVDDETENTK